MLRRSEVVVRVGLPKSALYVERRFDAVVLGNHDRSVLRWFRARSGSKPPPRSEWPLARSRRDHPRWRAALGAMPLAIAIETARGAVGIVHAEAPHRSWTESLRLLGTASPSAVDDALLGLWRGVSRESVARVLAPVAASGLAVALVTVPLLFSVRAREYSGVEFLQLKLTFIAVGVLATLAICRAHGFLLNDTSCNRVVGHAILSTVCWLGALVCGRLIAFAGD